MIHKSLHATCPSSGCLTRHDAQTSSELRFDKVLRSLRPVVDPQLLCHKVKQSWLQLTTPDVNGREPASFSASRTDQSSV